MQTAHHTVAAKVDSSVSYSDSSAAFAADPDAHRESCRRLAGLALTYVVGFLLFYSFALLSLIVGAPRPTFWIETGWFLLAATIGLTTYIFARDARIPPARFATFVILFQIATSIAIVGDSWGWETREAAGLEQMWGALGLPGDLVSSFVRPLEAAEITPFSVDGISALGLWIMIVPFVVPLPLRHTLIASVVSLLTLPGLALLSLWAHGTPPALRQWGPGMLVDMTILNTIASAIGVYGSRVTYRLTRELARAKRMGSYQLVEKIGSGGMGEVWRAKHRLLVRPAAIKLIRVDALGHGRDVATRTALARFEREAQATSALTSPHSIEIYDFGITDDGTFFYVMELLDGLDLRSLVDRFGPLPAERAIHILKQACHSLADAHAQGLIHRDIKPANIFACRRGLDHDFVKVLDFGLVKRQSSDGTRTQLTVEGIASGTPAFMAPEMATGERVLDGRADLYALGCVAYWLLTGKLVFEGDSAMQVVLHHVRDVPTPPSSRTEMRIPEDLERLVLDLLHKDPESRPTDARALAARLDACGHSLAPWTPERARSWWSAHEPTR